jgi:hypothetical protein
MSVDGLEFKRRSDLLYIHFDVRDHFLKLETFIETARQTQRIVDALDQDFFDGKLDYELIVLAPESGTFLTKVALVTASIAAVAGFLSTDPAKGLLKGLTGHEPYYWAEQLGKTGREMVDNALGLIEDQSETTDEPELPEEVSKERDADGAEACRAASKIVVEMARGVLEKSSGELERLEIESGGLSDAIEARNEFYTACIADPDVRGIGFTPKDEFPIPRSSFPERAVTTFRREEDEEPLPWEVSIESIFVTSPNWDKDDQAVRHWKGKNSAGRSCYFIIEDEEFWLHAKKRDIRPDFLDHLRVQWAFQVVGGRVKNRRVLRVLEFNGEKLAEPLDDNALRAKLGDFSDVVSNKGQRSLF